VGEDLVETEQGHAAMNAVSRNRSYSSNPSHRWPGAGKKNANGTSDFADGDQGLGVIESPNCY